MKIKNIILNILIAFSMLVLPFASKADAYVVKADEAIYESNDSYKAQLDKTLDFIIESNDNPEYGFEWKILGLARSNNNISKEYLDTYINNVEKSLVEQDGQLNAPTDYSRLIIALSALDIDVKDVKGFDLLNVFANYDFIVKQGLNSVIFALIALDSRQYEIPVDENINTQATREMYLEYILDKEIEDGGFAWFGNVADIDMTAMTLQALAPYYNTNEAVKKVVDNALTILSDQQAPSGGYVAWGSESSPTIAQVILALTELNIDPHTDARFIKEGNSLVDALMAYAVDTGGFKFMLNGNVDIGMPTEQGAHALVAYDRFMNGLNSLYDMSDLDIVDETPTPEEVIPTPEEENPTPEVETPEVENNEVEYEILDNIKETVSKDEDIVIRVQGSVEDFKELRLNGEVVDEKYYTIKEGSVIITILKSFIETLPEKEHSLEINFVNGTVTTSFNLTASTKSDNSEIQDEDQDEDLEVEDKLEIKEEVENVEANTSKEKANKPKKTNTQEVLPQTGSVSLFMISSVFMILGMSILHLNKKD